MEQLQSALEPYRHLDPMGWVGLFRFLPVWGGLVAIAFGAVMMLYGGRQLFRLVAGPLGALIATVWAAPLAARLGFGGSIRQLTLVATIGLFGAGLLWPPAVIFFAFGVPAGLAGGQLAGSDWLLGFGPGFLVGGAIGVVLHRLLAAIISAVAGAWVAVLGLMAVLNPFVPAIAWLAANPVAVMSVAGVLALAGLVFQLYVRPSEEQAEELKLKRTLEKKKEKERKEVEARWAKYNEKK
ncbi:MAG: hypothetical protein ACOZQL_35960 [Myxococcota bacterium]